MIFRWMLINILIIIIVFVWSFSQGFQSNQILIGKFVSQLAFILFLINGNMYFVFLFIRKIKGRKMKVQLAKISKQMMKYHIPLATSGTLLIVIHALIMYNRDQLTAKMVAGIFSFIVLLILLFSGLLRRWKASGKRRKFHYMMAFIFMGTTFVHIFINH